VKKCQIACDRLYVYYRRINPRYVSVMHEHVKGQSDVGCVLAILLV